MPCMVETRPALNASGWMALAAVLLCDSRLNAVLPICCQVLTASYMNYQDISKKREEDNRGGATRYRREFIKDEHARPFPSILHVCLVVERNTYLTMTHISTVEASEENNRTGYGSYCCTACGNKANGSSKE